MNDMNEYQHMRHEIALEIMASKAMCYKRDTKGILVARPQMKESYEESYPNLLISFVEELSLENLLEVSSVRFVTTIDGTDYVEFVFKAGVLIDESFDKAKAIIMPSKSEQIIIRFMNFRWLDRY